MASPIGVSDISILDYCTLHNSVRMSVGIMIAAVYVKSTVITLGCNGSSINIDRLLGISLVQAYQYFSGSGAGDSRSQQTFVHGTFQCYTHFQTNTFS